MISVKDAAQRAAEFARVTLEHRADDLQLEEVEIDQVMSRWHITLSMSSLPAWGTARKYKTFTVDGNTGEVLSMKIRELAGAA
jgi:hypothetical protein